MTERVKTFEERRRHRRLVLLILLLMILINLIVRYPVDHATPLGSDTFFTLDMSRSLQDYGHAKWILSPWSYLGLYPLSYPSGTIFMYTEYHILTGTGWNSVPLAFGMFFTVLFVLGGFMLFRIFRLGDSLSAVMAGLMALSPFFLYFTYEQASTRGFLVPLFVIGLYFVFWQGVSNYRRLSLFIIISISAIFIHRSGLVILLFEGLAGLVAFLAPYLYSKSLHVKRSVYAAFVTMGLSLILWPWIPGLNTLFNQISELSSTYRVAQWEFSTGIFFQGDSPFILLANLATNYIGSIGLILLLMPGALIILYPKSRESRDRDSFLIAVLLIFAPFLWKVQYIQLLFVPFAYLVGGLIIQRRRRFAEVYDELRRRIRPRQTRRTASSDRPARSGISVQAAIMAFFIVCMLFSVAWFSHRLQSTDPYTYEDTWPSDSMRNLGTYINAYQKNGTKAFVSNSDLLDRRIAWFSQWNCPVMDSAALQADGYLNATQSSYVYDQTGDKGFLNFLTLFYKLESVYDLNVSSPDWKLLELSWGDPYGFFHLYYRNSSEALMTIPTVVSVARANISLYVQINHLGSSLSNPYLLEGALPSRFLAAVVSDTYVIYSANDYSIYQISTPEV